MGFGSWAQSNKYYIICYKNIYMSDYKIKLIRSILNDFYKNKKRYMKNHKIRHVVIKYKKSKKEGKRNRFDA